tara:strand:- start:249 stop:677 length:429 start_codon:yes stop_codon:yes gene_type:complete
MDNSISLSILIPLTPLGMTFFIFLLLRSFNRTINRLTKPVSFLAIGAILFSTGFSLFLLLNHKEGLVPLSNYFSFLKSSDLELHINELTEKFIIVVGSIFSLILIFSLLKLPRRNGYVMYVINLSLLASITISSLLILDFPF